MAVRRGARRPDGRLPVDENIEEWREEQQKMLAEQVRVAPYSRELWRAMTRTTNMQQQIASLKDLLIASRACIATARSHSQRLASSAQALDHPIWSAAPSADHPDSDQVDTTPAHHADGMTNPDQHHDRFHPDGSVRYPDQVIRRI